MSFPRPAFRGLIAFGAASALGSGALAVAFARGTQFGADIAARGAVHSLASPALTAVMQIATWAGSWAVLTVVTLLGTLLLHHLGAGWRAMLLPVATVGAVVLENGLKLLVRRARPDPYFGTVLPVSYSFPSGHALDSLVIYIALAMLLAPYVRERGARVALFAAVGVLVLAIGVSRVYLGVHWPSDVIGGWAVAAAWLAGWAALARRWNPALLPGGTAG